MCLRRARLSCCTTRHSGMKATIHSALLHKAGYYTHGEQGLHAGLLYITVRKYWSRPCQGTAQYSDHIMGQAADVFMENNVILHVHFQHHELTG